MTISEKSVRNILLGGILLLGFIAPFIDYIVVIEFFYLLIPMGALFVASLVFLVFSRMLKRRYSHTAFLLAAIVPTFVVAQVASTYMMDKIQRFRSELIIEKIQENPQAAVEQRPKSFGVNFLILDHKNNYRISYSRGFMVNEIYDSRLKIWKSQGWND